MTMRSGIRLATSIYAILIYGFIFLPVATLVLFSFQATLFPIPPFTGPSLRWYQAVLSDDRLTSALTNSLFVAVISSAMATLLALMVLTIRRNSEYGSGLRIWETVVARYPHARAYENLAVQLRDAGRDTPSRAGVPDAVR